MKQVKKSNKKTPEKKSRNLKGMRVLIFGASGFIGKAMTKAYKKMGAEVTTISRNEYDALDTSPVNIKKLETLVKNKDIIINLMAIVNSHDLSLTNESEIVNVNFQNHLLDAIKKNNPKARIIFSSSQTVYGETTAHSIDESHPTKPVTLYAQQKRNAEKIYEEYARTHNIPVTILRLSNVYGPEAPISRSVISLFLEKAHGDDKITVFGKGDELRDYIYIDDVVQAFIKASDAPLDEIIYNVGSGDTHSLSEIAKMVTAHVGKGKIIHIPFPPNYARYRGHIILDSTKFKKKTQWKSATKLKEGLKKMYNRNKKQ